METIEIPSLDSGSCASSSLLSSSSSPVSPPSNNITCIDRELYKAAVEGNFNEFINVQSIESILTPNKNTVLHVHLTSTETTPSLLPLPFLLKIRIKFLNPIIRYKSIKQEPVSEHFVQQILEKCEGLLLLPNIKGETPLHLAARYGHSAIVNLLIERAKGLLLEIESGIGAEKRLLRAETQENDTALHEAIRHCHYEIVEILLNEDPELSNIANKAKETPLFLSSERGYMQIVSKILELVESPAYEGPNGRTALHAAVINGNLEMAIDLLKNEHVRAATKHTDENGWTPLHYAVKVCNKSLTELLLKQDGSTAYMQDKEGRTTLHVAAYYGNLHNMEAIIKFCPDCAEVVDNKGRNALHYGVNAERLFVVGKMMQNLSLSGLYNERDVDGNTPLHHLAYCRLKSWELIFHRRINKLVLNNKDQTPLDIAYATVEYSPLRKKGIIWRLQKVGARVSQRLITLKSKNMGPRAMLTFTKEAKESHLIVATLIATVTFAATFTLPGGTVQDGELKGTPILRDKAAFKAFIVSNTIAMVMAASATFIHLFSPLNKAKYLDYYFSEVAFSFILIAIAAMIVAFGTETYVILGSSSIGISIITVGLSFFLVFRQVLNMSFGGNSIFTFIKNLVNTMFFPFLKFAAKPFGFYFLLFKRTYNPKGRIIF